jgi:putative salt-induced outer membrane protein YdiY
MSFPHTAAVVTLICLLLALSSPGVLAKYDDVLFLENGDRTSGDIKELNRDLLRYKPDSMGTIYIPWTDIRSIETEKFLRIELKSGRRLIGKIGRADAPEQLVIATRTEDEVHPFDELVAFVPLKLKRQWIDRIEGDVRFGLSGTKGSDTVQWNLGANALYRGEDWEISSRWDSIMTDKSDDTSSQRIVFNNAYRKLLKKGWYWNLLMGYEKNDELGVKDRWSLGGGIGQFLLRSNIFELMWQGGLGASREFRTDSVNNQVEAYAGARFAWFQHRFPKTDIRTDVLVYPSLTESGRLRTNWDVSVAREIVEDLSLDLSVYYTTDNQPPDEASRDDWGIVTSLEYSF